MKGASVEGTHCGRLGQEGTYSEQVAEMREGDVQSHRPVFHVDNGSARAGHATPYIDNET